nr:EpsG family protein [Qipengyuania pelagi]
MVDVQKSPHLGSRELSALILVVAWGFLSYAAATRLFGLGRDYIEYLSFYQAVPVYLSTSTQRFELGFSFAAWLFRYVINVDYPWFAFAIIATSLGIKFFLFWKYLRYPLIGAVYYLVTFYPIHEYTQVRTALGLALGYLALHLAYERRFVRAVIAIAIGATFHASVVILLPMYLAATYGRKSFPALSVVSILILAVGLSDSLRSSAISFFSDINPLLAAYAQNREFNEISIFSLNNIGLLLAIFLGFFAGWQKESRYHSLFFVISIGAILVVIGLSGVPMVAQRVKEVLYVSTIFVAHRSVFSYRNIPAVMMLWLTGGLLFYLNLHSDVLGGY